MFAREKKPALLYILHSGNLYGTERMALATLEGMSDYRERVVFAPAPGGTASVGAVARLAGYEYVPFDTRASLLRKLVSYFLHYEAIDIIGTGVVHSTFCHWLGKLFGVRVRQLHVAHGGTPTSFDRKRALNKYPVVMVAVSNFVRDELLKRNVRAGAITVIDNFLSRSQLAEYAARGSYLEGRTGGRKVDPRNVRIAVVSRVDGIKRLDVLVESLERHGLTNFHFDVFGAGDQLDVLKQRSAPIGNITFHGYVPDIKTRLAQADFLLHMCPEEPFGLVALEAFAAGVVVIVPDAGGIAAVVRGGESGLRFRSNDVDDLARVLEKAQSLDGADLEVLAAGARRALDNRFSQAEGVRHYQGALDVAGTVGRALPT